MHALFITLGCAKNEVDTDRMRALLAADGFEEALAVSDADVAIVNTCSFLETATSESIECTLELADEIARGVRGVPIIMCGCVPSRYGGELADELPEVAAFVRHDEEDGIVQVVRHVLGIDRTPCLPPHVLRTVEGASAFLKISEGCNRFCSFCAIPYIRGRYCSRPLDELLDEARALLERRGYDSAAPLPALLAELARRIGLQKSFPHEIGLFLGYPPGDVAGFIEHRGQQFALAGYWKVYENEEEARALFALYAHCTEEFCGRLAAGQRFEDLVAAV